MNHINLQEAVYNPLRELEQNLSEREIDRLFKKNYTKNTIVQILRERKTQMDSILESIHGMAVSLLMPVFTIDITDWAKDESVAYCKDSMDSKEISYDIIYLLAYCLQSREKIADILKAFDSLNFG